MTASNRNFALPAAATTLVSMLLTACSSTAPDNLGKQADGTLAPCPDRPNCVSSFSDPGDKKHRIKPLEAPGNEWERLPVVLEAMPRIEITEHTEDYLRATATTRVLRFVDDLEFLHRPEEKLIHVRSASRVGYSDLGANRKRIEEIRARLQDEQR